MKNNPGMTRKQWENQCAKTGIPQGTFKPAVSTLKKKHVFEDRDNRWWPKSQTYEVTGYKQDNLAEPVAN